MVEPAAAVDYDLSGLVTHIEPTETPFISMASQGMKWRGWSE